MTKEELYKLSELIVHLLVLEANDEFLHIKNSLIDERRRYL